MEGKVFESILFYYSLSRLLWVLVRIKTSSKWFYFAFLILIEMFVYSGMAVSSKLRHRSA